MVCRICDQIGLRSFRYVPFAYYVKGDPYAKGLSKEEFELLLRCDGNQELLDFWCERASKNLGGKSLGAYSSEKIEEVKVCM